MMADKNKQFEEDRLKELYDLNNILHTSNEENFNRYVTLASTIFNVPLAFISFMDRHSQWLKATVGFEQIEIPRHLSFCAYTILEEDIFVVSNALEDNRFSENPLVQQEPHLRFYAGCVLKGPSQKPIGTLCVMDKKPRRFSHRDKQKLLLLANLIEQEIHHYSQVEVMKKNIESHSFPDSLINSPNGSKILELNHRLREAIEQDHLEVYYQPKVDLLSGAVCGAEALCRWNDPTRGLILPSEFIPIAEHSPLIEQLESWVLKKTCSQNKQWQTDGLPSLKISVNISGKHLLNKNFIQNIDGIIQETHYDPRYLDLEITESALIWDPMLAQTVVNHLNRKNITFSLDDFGTGYASLVYIRRIRPDSIKIDKSYIDNLVREPRDALIVQAIINVSKKLGYTTVAEGVETEEQLNLLREYGCDQIQGYLFSPPVPAHEFSKILASESLASL